MIRLHTRTTWYDADGMDYNEAAKLHASGKGAFDVVAAEFGHSVARRMSIAVSEVVRIEDLP